MSAAGLDAVLPLLACPHCTLPLARRDPTAVGCAAGHRFDIARQGYLSLLGKGSRTDTGDSADMVQARVAFLGAAHYRPIADRIADLLTAGPVLEVGAGTGYYLGIALDRLRVRGAGAAVGIALDASRYAARRAAVADPAIGSIVADAWSRLPLADGVVRTVLSVFAPRDPAEVARVLAPGGRLIVVTPEPDHLVEIRSTLGLLTVDAGKPERLAAAFDGLLEPVERSEFRAEMALTREEVSDLVRMGPSARHIPSGRLAAQIDTLDEWTTVTVAVTLSVLHR